MASLVLGVAGAALLGPAGLGFGGFLGISGAGIGWTIGSFVGSMLGAKGVNQEGPRLGDLTVQTSTYGQPRPIIEGTVRIGGNVIWASAIREEKTTTSQSGKGGPKVTTTTYAYFVDVAIGLGQSELQAIRKAWTDGELVIDLSGSRPFEVAVATPLEYDSLTLYPGNYTQLPDPTIEAAEGVGNTPAYRGEAYVVIKNLDITRFGRIPQLTFEVCRSATVAASRSIIVVNPFTSVNFTQTCFKQDRIYPINLRSDLLLDVYQIDATDTMSLSGAITPFSGDFDGGFSARTVRACNSSDGWIISDNGVLPTGSAARKTSLTNLFDGSQRLLYSYDGTSYQFDPITSTIDEVTGLAAATFSAAVTAVLPNRCGIYSGNADALVSPTLNVADVGTYVAAYDGILYVMSTSFIYAFDVTNINTTPIPTLRQVIANTYGDMMFASSDGLFVFNSSARTIPRQMYLSTDQGATFTALSTPFLIPDANQNYSTSWYCCKDYALFGPCQESAGTPDDLTDKWFIVNFANVVPDLVPLDEIVARRTESAGLDVSQYDVSDLESDNVQGYIISRQASARQAVEPLGKSYSFDAVESDGQIKYIKRGINAPVATIDYEDLAAHEFGQEPGDVATITRRQEDELPKAISVTYINTDNDYQAGSELAQRINTTSLTSISEELPEATDADHAATVANKLLWEAWSSRTEYSFATTRKYAHLDPADVVLVEKTPGSYLRLRIASATDTGLLCEFTAVEDVPSIYGQEWAGSPTASTGQSLASPPPGTTLKIIDIPLLRDVDDFAGVYSAVGSTSASWRGATVFGGNSESTLGDLITLTNKSVVGTSSDALANYTGPRFFDMTNTVTVYTTGELYNASRADVLTNRANACTLGGELMAFLTATLNADGSYTLSGLLRGQFGTERAMSTHVAGESFAMLQNAGIGKLTEQIGDINTSRIYKAVSLGQRLSQAPSIPFTPTGVVLKPYAPFNLRKAASGSDWVLSCQRRTRYSENWLRGIVPLGEGSEAYEWEIYTSSAFTTVIRTLTSSTSSATYTSAMQTADFGTAQTTLYVRVYQMSSAIGRGFPLTATV